MASQAEIDDLIGKKFFWKERCEETGADQSGYYEIKSADKRSCWCYLSCDERNIDIEIELPTDWVIQLTDPD